MEHLSTYHDGEEDNLDGIKSASPQHSEFLLRLKGLIYRPFMMKLKKLSTMQEGTSLLITYAIRKSGIGYIPHLILANGQTFS